MEVVDKEQFCFDIINQLLDEYGLHIDDYTKLVNQVWEANSHKEMDGILQFLQRSLLECMRLSVPERI